MTVQRSRTPATRTPHRFREGRSAWNPVVGLALALGAALAAAQPSTGGSTAASGPKESRAAAAGNAVSTGKQAGARTHRASRIIGMDVVNRQGQKVGDIEDIVLDRNGNAAYAVVSTGGFLGLGERLHAIPWRSLEADAATGRFTLDVDKETLSRAPGFDNASFPDVDDPRWSAENRKHFPVASTAAARSSTTGSESTAPRKKERDDTRATSGRSPNNNDIGPTLSTSRRSGPAAGSGSAAAPGPGSSSGTAAGSTGAADSGPPGSTPGTAATNPAGGSGGPTSTGGAAPANGPVSGTTK